MSKLSRWSTLFSEARWLWRPPFRLEPAQETGPDRSLRLVRKPVAPISSPAARSAVTPINGTSTPIEGSPRALRTSRPRVGGSTLLRWKRGIHASPTVGTPVLPVGAYTVNTDCTIAATITDTSPLQPKLSSRPFKPAPSSKA